MVRVSSKLRLEVLRRRSEGQTQYSIAREVGLHPSVLSSLMHDIIPLRENDERVLKVGRLLGLADADCFEPITDKGAKT